MTHRSQHTRVQGPLVQVPESGNPTHRCGVYCAHCRWFSISLLRCRLCLVPYLIRASFRQPEMSWSVNLETSSSFSILATACTTDWTMLEPAFGGCYSNRPAFQQSVTRSSTSTTSTPIDANAISVRCWKNVRRGGWWRFGSHDVNKGTALPMTT